MSTGGLLILFIAFIAVAALGQPVWRAVRAWRRSRGLRLVTCPETHQPAAVAIDAGHAALTAFIEGTPDLHLQSCSRWATRGHCDEPCLPDVDASGHAADVHVIADHWFAGATCAYCRKPIEVGGLVDHHPAFVDAAGVTVEWSDVPPERLPEMMKTHYPVCWNCHVAETFRRQFPERVVDRPDPSQRGGTHAEA
jgi:hypothetical protein